MPRFLQVIGLILAIQLGLALDLRGADDFRLVPRPIEIPERGTVTGYSLLTPTGRYFFLPPEGWKIRTDAEEKKISLTTLDLSVMISFTFHSGSVSDLLGQSPEERRAKVLENFSGGHITNEFTAYSSGGTGPAFDVLGFVRHKKKMAARVAYISAGRSTVEFSLHTSLEKFRDQVFAFGTLLTSFRAENQPPGK